MCFSAWPMEIKQQARNETNLEMKRRIWETTSAVERNSILLLYNKNVGLSWLTNKNNTVAGKSENNVKGKKVNKW